MKTMRFPTHISFKTRIKEAEPAKLASNVTAISKDLEDQTSNFKAISTKEKMEQLLDAVVGKLDPKFTESPGFKQAVLSFYKKYK
jgi:hypothetical protein